MKLKQVLILLLLNITIIMSAQSQNKTLVAYFSRSGNTKLVAEYIQEITGADIVRIEPVDAYPPEYRVVVDQAKKEINEGFYPEIKQTVENLNDYDTIFIGTPNWWNTMAPPVGTFLKSFDFTGKTLIPFCTHGGGGKGHIFKDIEDLAVGAKVLKGFSIDGYSVNDCKNELEEWLNDIKKL